MKTSISRKLWLSKILSISVLSIGFILLAFMIKFEDEPGALPLFLILAGTVWFFITRHQINKASKKIEQ